MKIVRPLTITSGMFTSDVPENDYAAYNGGTTYALGAHVISTSTHRIYESLQNANTGNALPVSPATSTAWWLDIGATNRWKCLDGGVSTQTVQADGLEYVFAAGRIDSVALLNMQGSTYRVELQSGSPAVTIYDTGDVSIEQAAIADWYQYFFEPIIQITDVVLTNVPPYSDGVLTVTVSAPGADAMLGMLIIGNYRDLGETQWKPRVGIIDYSRKETDDFGNTVIVERAFSKRMSAEVVVSNHLIDEVNRLIAQYRATPMVWVGDEGFGSTIVYGFYRAFDSVIDSPAGSIFNLEVEGLT